MPFYWLWIPAGKASPRAEKSVGNASGPTGRRGVYYGGFAVGEVAESAEGSRLLSGYRAKSSVQGSNPCLSASGPLAQVDRASGYEPEGQRFESSRAHHLSRPPFQV